LVGSGRGVHDDFGVQASPAAVKIFQDAFDCGYLDDGEEARLGAGLRGVRAVALARRVQPVDCTPHVVPLGNLDAVGEDFDGEGVVGNLLSESIQFCRGWKRSGSHPLRGVPWGGGQDRAEERQKEENWEGGGKEGGERHRKRQLNPGGSVHGTKEHMGCNLSRNLILDGALIFHTSLFFS